MFRPQYMEWNPPYFSIDGGIESHDFHTVLERRHRNIKVFAISNVFSISTNPQSMDHGPVANRLQFIKADDDSFQWWTYNTLNIQCPSYRLCLLLQYIPRIIHVVDAMITSSNGNIFRVTGPLCGEFTGPGEFPSQRPATRNFDVFFDLRLNNRLSKQSWGWCFETPSRSLWRHCNALLRFAHKLRHSYSFTWPIMPFPRRQPRNLEVYGRLDHSNLRTAKITL